MAKGKKFDTWSFEIDGQDIKIECRQEPDGDGGIRFAVHEPTYDLLLHDVNPNALKAAVRKHLKETIVTAWEYFLVVETRRLGDDAEEEYEDEVPVEKKPKRRPYLYTERELDPERCYFTMAVKSGLVIEVTPWRKADVGSKMRYEYLMNGSRWWDTEAPELLSAGPKERQDDDASRAILPITEANLQAMRDILAGMDQLQRRMSELLSPDRIEMTLLTVQTPLPMLPLAPLPALPAPTKAPPKSKKR